MKKFIVIFLMLAICLSGCSTQPNVVNCKVENTDYSVDIIVEPGQNLEVKAVDSTFGVFCDDEFLLDGTIFMIDSDAQMIDSVEQQINDDPNAYLVGVGDTQIIWSYDYDDVSGLRAYMSMTYLDDNIVVMTQRTRSDQFNLAKAEDEFLSIIDRLSYTAKEDD